MNQKSSNPASPSERLVKDIRRVARKLYSAEDKIRIVLDGLRGEGVPKWVVADRGYSSHAFRDHIVSIRPRPRRRGYAAAVVSDSDIFQCQGRSSCSLDAG